MTEGFALIAWPAKYDDTGVMTFIVNQDGVVYQKNLGPGTDAAARAIKAYNPDAQLAEGRAAKQSRAVRRALDGCYADFDCAPQRAHSRRAQ